MNISNRLDEISAQIEGRSQPPVHLWKPENHGEIDIRIDEQGFWFHEGTLISRDKLVQLFASILWFEEGAYFLVTPAEKLKISVADVPFVIQQMEFIDGVWVALTNTQEPLIVGSEHPVTLRDYKGQAIPYIKVRYDLWARVNRSIYYQWVTTALERQSDSASELSLFSGEYKIVLGAT